MSESLSPLQRLELIQLVNALPATKFEELLYALQPDSGVVPPNMSAQGNRAKVLLDWAEGPLGCGLEMFLCILDKVAPGRFSREPTSAKPSPQAVSRSVREPEPTFTVELGSGVPLAMVYIPGGRFWMGSPESEPKRRDSEGPQHKVTVPAFYMGKYAVTQRQWRAVSLLDDVERPLAPNPSCFKGDNLPVECVSWFDAVEFCQRLSRHTGHEYRLPSEAEWEYACRAGTSTPFHFGETISTDQANYNGDSIYGKGQKGMYRKKTTPVGSFDANRFGLYDMHGNVWEWCQDHWHENYEGAPIDGSAWLSSDESKNRVVRGGSWDADPVFCRSAYRIWFDPGNDYDLLGFRVCCSAPRALQ